MPLLCPLLFFGVETIGSQKCTNQLSRFMKMSNVKGHILCTTDTKSEAQMLFRNVCFLLNWERITR